MAKIIRIGFIWQEWFLAELRDLNSWMENQEPPMDNPKCVDWELENMLIMSLIDDQ